LTELFPRAGFAFQRREANFSQSYFAVIFGLLATPESETRMVYAWSPNSANISTGRLRYKHSSKSIPLFNKRTVLHYTDNAGERTIT
jgi:hypothetical protein